MFAVEMLPGGHGDALVVEYGTKTDPHQLLIDAGTFHSWDGVRKELMRRRRDRYEIFVITHVDEDHIGGAIALLDDPNLKQRINDVWFNGFVHCRTGGNVLGPVNGEQLTTRIVEGGLGLPYPRLHVCVMHAVARRVHVDAADNVVARIENGESKARPIDEVSGMPLQISAVLVHAHLTGPVPIGEARRASNVFDARRPGCVIALVVLRAERLKAKLPSREAGRRNKISGHE